jgi:DNA-binding response OmpR family regulator
LNAGADDYLGKPFNPLELLARVKSQLRRYTVFGSMEKLQDVWSTGGLVLDDSKKQVTVDGEIAKLTPNEYKILKYLMQNMGSVLSTTQIYENVWDERAMGIENTVAVHIRHIREKIEINPKDPKYLKVVWGIGYTIEKIKV